MQVLKKELIVIGGLALGLLGAGTTHAQQAPTLKMSLLEAEQQAVTSSNRLKAAESDSAAMSAQAEAQHDLLLPKLTLDGYYRYITEVPELNTGGRRQVLGDNVNYSIGPLLTYTVFDGGALRNTSQSFELLSKARKEDVRNTAEQVTLAVRLAYFRAQLSLEEMKMVADSLKLARAQERDINNRLSAGAASKTDQLSAHKETLSYNRRFEQVRADLASSLRDLFALTGQNSLDPSIPLDARLMNERDSRTTSAEPTTLVIALDSLDTALQEFSKTDLQPALEKHPQVQALEQTSEASRRAAHGASAEAWPKVQLSAKTSLDYPNGPLLEQFNQNLVGVTLSMPLLDWGRTRDQSSQRQSEAMAADYRRQQLLNDMNRDWHKIRDLIDSLGRQQNLVTEEVDTADRLANQMYASYRAGRANYLDVQSANLRTLEARVQAARIKSQLLVQRAYLQSLSAKEK